MSNCTRCQKKYKIFKIDRVRCVECEQQYCMHCIRKQSQNGFRSYCESCLVLNTRPVNRSSLMDLRSREVKMYLNRRQISTDNCIEKEDLVNRFLRYVEREPRENRNKKNLLNGLVSSLTNSMPNLFENNTPRRNEGGSPTGGGGDGGQYASATSSSQQPTQEPQPEPTSTPNRKLIQLSDISDTDDITNLSVKQLKELLLINRVDFRGCVEKEELQTKVMHLWLESKVEDPVMLTTQELCKICMDAPLNCVLLECGHIATCISCGKQLAECPICRQYIVRVVHTFKA